MAEALAPLRIQGIMIVPYLDDLLLFVSSKEQLLTNLNRTPLAKLGLAPKQGEVESGSFPSDKVLGYNIDLVQQKIFLPEEKRERILRAVKQIQT